MSLVIKGMEMQMEWEQITITVYRDGVWCVHCDNEPHGKVIPLPAGHGELIDKQAFKADIDGFIECMTKVGAVVDGEMLWGKLLDALENAKPIVPAEGGANE